MRYASRMVLLGLLAAFAVGAVAASSALASPEWYVKKAGVFKKVTGPVKVNIEKNYELNTGYEEIRGKDLVVSCKGAEGIEGDLEPGGAGVISRFQGLAGQCKGAGSEPYCEEFTRDEGIDLPWKTELYKEGSEVRNRILKGNEPAWHFTCKTWPLGEEILTRCNVNTTTHMANNTTTGAVEAEFEKKSNKTICTVGTTSKEAGEWKGVLTVKPTESEKKAGVEAIKVE
jgi:hypothetical protein